jgi:hypothetical protein
MRKIAMKEIASDTDLASAAEEFTRKYGKSLNTVIEGLTETPKITVTFNDTKGRIDTKIAAHQMIREAFETATDTGHPKRFNLEYSYKDQVGDFDSASAVSKDTLGERLKFIQYDLREHLLNLPDIKAGKELSVSDQKKVDALGALNNLLEGDFARDYLNLQNRIDEEASRSRKASVKSTGGLTPQQHAEMQLAKHLQKTQRQI